MEKKQIETVNEGKPSEQVIAERLNALIKEGKKKGMLSSKELMDVLEELNLEQEQIDKFYDTLENLSIDITEGDGLDMLPIDDLSPDIEDLDTKEIPLCLFSKWVGPYQAEMGQNLQEVRETGTPCRFVRRIYSLNRPRKIAMMFQMEPQICQARTSRMTTDKMVAKVVITLAPYFSLMRAPVSRSNRWVLSPRTSSLMTSPA